MVVFIIIIFNLPSERMVCVCRLMELEDFALPEIKKLSERWEILWKKIFWKKIGFP